MSYSSSNLSGWASGMIECGGYSGISVSAVTCWLENSLGNLNVKLSSEYEMVSGVVSPEMSVNDMAIYTQMFDCYFLSRAARQASAYALTDSAWSRIDGDEQGYIARSTPSELAKVYRGLAADCNNCVDDLIYQYNKGLALPRQVLTYSSVYSDGLTQYLPPMFLSRNVICNE